MTVVKKRTSGTDVLASCGVAILLLLLVMAALGFVFKLYNKGADKVETKRGETVIQPAQSAPAPAATPTKDKLATPNSYEIDNTRWKQVAASACPGVEIDEGGIFAGAGSLSFDMSALAARNVIASPTVFWEQMQAALNALYAAFPACDVIDLEAYATLKTGGQVVLFRARHSRGETQSRGYWENPGVFGVEAKGWGPVYQGQDRGM